MRTPFFSIICLCLLLASCTGYTPPDISGFASKSFSKTVESNYDDTWEKLIDYSSEFFFTIDRFEKESGLIILSFDAPNPTDYVTGGRMVAGGFDDDWVLWTVGTHTSLFFDNGVALSGKINITARKISRHKTKITVNTKYTLAGGNPIRGKINISFNTGNCGSQNVGSGLKTVCPTHLIEDTILAAF